jgi:hypothetical protein
MKIILFLFLAIIMLAGCSAPKYTYNFDYYDYNSGRKATVEPVTAALASPLEHQQSFEPSASSTMVSLPEKLESVARREQSASAKKFGDMTASEKKAFKKEVKEHIKNYKQSIRKGEAGQMPEAMNAMDNDLKLAIIFGAVGLTLTLFGAINEAFWILGVISIVVGVVFLIKWLVRQ